MPQNPEVWLLTTARHSLIDLMRDQQVALASEPTLLLHGDEPKEATLSAEFPDERLKLLFVCTHPAIDPTMHTPLYAPDRSWPGCSAYCSCLPGLTDDDGAAPGACQDFYFKDAVHCFFFCPVEIAPLPSSPLSTRLSASRQGRVRNETARLESICEDEEKQ